MLNSQRYSLLCLEVKSFPLTSRYGQTDRQTTINLYICDSTREKGPLCAKCDVLPFFKLSPFQDLKSPGFLAWFISSLGLLLHRSDIRSYSEPSVPSGELPKRGIKWQFLNMIDTLARPAHTRNGRAQNSLRVYIAG